MEAKVTWDKGMRFVGVGPSGHPVAMDAGPEVGGGDTAPRPTELLLVALGGCTGMDVVSILEKMRTPARSLEVVISAERAPAAPQGDSQGQGPLSRGGGPGGEPAPGVAQPCREIAEAPEKVFQYTNKGNMVAVVSDGTRVLGLGDIGPEAALPVMEGKGLLFKYLGAWTRSRSPSPRRTPRRSSRP
ncbi:MAG: OsmC family protein [Candidatus Acetothermia bacterium]|jgi:hypothetical protein|nr:OsmC family protein [Candidatus Acetothermia bacterium]